MTKGRQCHIMPRRITCYCRRLPELFRGVAQLVEHRSPKPGVAGSSPVSPAKVKGPANGWAFYFAGEADLNLRREFCFSKKRSGAGAFMTSARRSLLRAREEMAFASQKRPCLPMHKLH